MTFHSHICPPIPSTAAHTANMTGYWGPITASVDWCEDNYVVTHYIAEFANTVSSLPMVLVSLYALWWGLRYGRGNFYFVAACVSSACVGLGSMLFHGTLTKTGQVLDEVPMLICICSFFTCLKMTKSPKSTAVPLLAAAWCVVAVCIYSLAHFSIFCVMFFVSVCCTVRLAWKRVQECSTPQTKELMNVFVKLGAFGYLTGSVCFWVPEMFICGNRLEETHDSIGQHLYLHAVFHLLASLSIYSFLCFSILSLADVRQKRTELQMGAMCLPVVVVL